jgi:hypothetical protein
MILNQLYPKNKITIPHSLKKKKIAGCKRIVQLTTFKQLIKQLGKLKWRFLRMMLSRNHRKGRNLTSLSFFFQPKLQIFVNNQNNLCSKLHSSHFQSQKNQYIHFSLTKHKIKTMCNGISKNHHLLWSKNF